MPTLSFNINDLMKFSRVESVEKIFYAIRQFKGEIKNVEGEEVIVELEPDRPDLLSVEGLSRAIRNFFEIELSCTTYALLSSNKPCVEVYVKDAQTRPYIACAIIRNLTIDSAFIKSLMNMQEALHITLGRNRRKVAIGIHDYDKITPPIIYTEVSGDEKMVPLDMEEELSLKEILVKHPKGKAYSALVKGTYPVYIDGKGIFSFPPIINGARTRVNESTKNLFIELTGTDEKAVEQTLNVLVCNILERGGIVERVSIKYPNFSKITPDLTPKQMYVNVEMFNKLTGLRINLNEALTLLRRMGYGAEVVNHGEVKVIIPPYRVDILHPVDIIEDMLISYGYENITPELPSIMTVGKPSLIEVLEGKIRGILIGMGFQEVMTFTLTNIANQTTLMNITNANVLRLVNPVSEEYNCYRFWITPNLLRFLSQNKHSAYPQKIFEIGYVAIPSEDDIYVQRNTAIAISASRATFTDAKEVLTSLMDGLGVEASLEQYNHPSFISGRVAVVKVKNRCIGLIGEIHPKVLINFNIEMPVSILEFTHCQPTFPLKGVKVKTFKDDLTAKWL
ncbi:MAG: phenylalanine--tRNA ligase subunit beta [Candidatus Verstraetearchaeota archaeon]|jgi:phenylalanyl-tRNA synthetase beta chain|nr:phenylalanine--tRNA ligase subunit beta [Candidatus Verstraetearchaeota archaeon]